MAKEEKERLYQEHLLEKQEKARLNLLNHEPRKTTTVKEIKHTEKIVEKLKKFAKAKIVGAPDKIYVHRDLSSTTRTFNLEASLT